MEKASGLLERHKKLSMSVGAVLLLLAGAGAVYGIELYQYSQTPEAKEEREFQEAKKEITDTVAIAGKQVKLPQNEEPVLATVSDREQLQNQEFFKRAQNGDQLLMYPKNNKIFLYRPSTKKIVAYSNLKYGDPTPTVATTIGEVAGDSSSSGKILIETEN
jgi:hypothetical protein